MRPIIFLRSHPPYTVKTTGSGTWSCHSRGPFIQFRPIAAASALASESRALAQRETSYSALDSVTSSVLGTILRRAHTAEDIYRSGYNFCIRRLNKFACVCGLIRPNIIFQFVTAAQYNITCATLSAACARLSLIRSGRTHPVTVELTLPAW